jgi:hypothetical protein
LEHQFVLRKQNFGAKIKQHKMIKNAVGLIIMLFVLMSLPKKRLQAASSGGVNYFFLFLY